MTCAFSRLSFSELSFSRLSFSELGHFSPRVFARARSMSQSPAFAFAERSASAHSTLTSGEAPKVANASARSAPLVPRALQTFYAIHDADASARAIEALTTANVEHIARACGSYLGSSQASANEVASGTCAYAGRELKVGESLGKATVALAKKLGLDEIQTLVIARRANEGRDAHGGEIGDDAWEREATRFYFRERLGTIKCAHELLAKNAPEGSAMDEAVREMLKLGLEENLWRAIDGLMSGKATPEGGAAWAGQALEEIVALLEVLFLLYYNRVKCSPKNFLRLAKTFEAGALGRVPAASIELGAHVPPAQANAFTEDIRALCNVTLIAALDLESLVDRFSGKSLKEHAFLDADVLKSVTEMMEKWQCDRAHGATLLAWSTFLTLLPPDADFMPQGFSTATMTTKANECGIASFSLLLDAEQLRGEDSTVTLHKSVLKNMFSTILAAYDMLPVHRLPPFELNMILNVLEKLLSDQPVLCEQFWGGAREDGQEAPLFALLEGCRERFPYDSVPLLRMLAALSEGHRAAECVLAYAAQLPTVALPVPSSDILAQSLKPGPDAVMNALSGEIQGSVTALHRLTSPYIPGGYIEAGMRGLAIDMCVDNAPLIVWAAPADGLHLCLTRLSLLASAGLTHGLTTGESAELQAITMFLSKVLTNAPSFARPLLTCDVSESVPKGAPTDILNGLSLALHVSSKTLSTEDGIRCVATILRALAPLAEAAPARLIAEVLEAPLLAGTPGTGCPGLIRAVRDGESRLGEYPLTLAVLSLVERLLNHGGLGDRLEALVDHALQEVCVRHVQWRYKHKAEKWAVHAAVQRVIHSVFVPRIGDFAARLRNKVLSYLTIDKAVCFGAFAPLVYDANTLRRLHEEGGAPRAEEVTMLEDAIATVLQTIPLIVHHAGESFGGMIEKMLLIETVNDGVPFASSIASYAGYPYAAACCPLAIPSLVPLCAMAATVPLAATLDAKDRIEILKAMHRMFEHADVEMDAISDAADLLSAGIANQPEWIHMLLSNEDLGSATPSTSARSGAATNLATTLTLPAPGTPDATSVNALTVSTTASKLATPEKEHPNLQGAVHLIWNILEHPIKLRERSPRCLAALTRVFSALWRRQPLLSRSIQPLRDKNAELWKRLASCIGTSTGGDATAIAHNLSTASDVLAIFAVEAEISMISDRASVAASALFDVQVREWVTTHLASWIEMCLARDSCSLKRRETQYAAQSFVLQCVVALERDETAIRHTPLMADATFEFMCREIKDKLLANAAAKELRQSGASNRSILEAVSHEASLQTPDSIMTSDPVHRLLDTARSMNIEGTILVPPKPGVIGVAEYGESYLYDSKWVRIATGCIGTSHVEDQWGAPEGPLSALGRMMSGQLAETCVTSSIVNAQTSAICSLRTFIAAAAGSELPKMHAGVFTNQGKQASTSPSTALVVHVNTSSQVKPSKSLLDGWTREGRRNTVIHIAERLNAILKTDTASSPDYISPLAIETAELLSVVVQLWSVAISNASSRTPADLELIPVRSVLTTVANALSNRVKSGGMPMRGAAPLVNPLLMSMLFAIRAWLAGEQSKNTVQPSYELGQCTLPLIPLICHAAATVDDFGNGNGRITSSVALMILQDIAHDLLPTSALLQVLSAHKILPPLKPATNVDAIDSITMAALNTCLSLSQSEPGAQILLASDTIRQLAILCVELAAYESPSETADEMYCAALHVAAMLASSPLTSHVEVSDDLIRFYTALETRMLAALAPGEITTLSLREAEVTAFFFESLAKSFGGSWQVSSPEGQLRCRRAAATFLRWFAAPQVVSGVRCPRKTDADARLASAPSKTNAHQAWFQATARGDSVRDASSPLIGTTLAGSPIADASTRRTGNAHTETVAIALYAVARRCAEFLAAFPRAIHDAALGFDVTASLRDQCDAILCDDLAVSSRDARVLSSDDECRLISALQGLKRAARDIETLEARVPPSAAAAPSPHSPSMF